MPDRKPSHRRPRVVIVGAGFAGLNAAKTLAGDPVDVVLIDRTNYHKFQPLLYQVATAGLEPDEIVHPIRDLFRKHKNVAFRLGTVRTVDRVGRTVHLAEGPPVAYDYLILAAGAATNYFGVEGAARYAFPMKNVPDALHLRNHILRQFERCEREGCPEGALTFVVVGGGPTGVELAGQLTELFRYVLRGDYRRIDPAKAHVVLLEMLPDVLTAFELPLRRYARTVLEQRGVEVRTGATVDRVEPDGVVLEGGERIPARTLIWAAGVRASPLADTLDVAQEQGGRVRVETDLSLPGHPEVFVVGDLSGAADETGAAYGQLATVAIQQGRHAARQVLRRIGGKGTEPFRYFDPGIMATIGRNAAVAQLRGGIRFTGFFAWLLWATVHIAKIVGFRNRVDVLINWAYNYLTYDFNARLILDVLPATEESRPVRPEDVPEPASGSASGSTSESTSESTDGEPADPASR